MNSEILLDAFGMIDERYIDSARRYRKHRTAKAVPVSPSPAAPALKDGPPQDGMYVSPAEKQKPGDWFKWTVAAVFLAAASLTIAILPRFQIPDDSGAMPTLAPTTSNVPPVTTQPEEPIPDATATPSYCLEFDSVDSFEALHKAYTLSDQELNAYLEEKGYAQQGIDSRDALKLFILDSGFVPIPSLPNDSVKRITVKEQDPFITFTFTDVTMEIRKQADPEYVEAQTTQLGPIWQYEAYPLYFGAEMQAAGVSHFLLKLDAQGYLVTIELDAADQEEAVAMLEGLSFAFAEFSSHPNIPANIHTGDVDSNTIWQFDENTGKLTLSPKKQNVWCGGYMIAAHLQQRRECGSAGPVLQWCGRSVCKRNGKSSPAKQGL